MTPACPLTDRRTKPRIELTLREIDTLEDRQRCYEVLQELRPKLTWTQFVCMNAMAGARDEFRMAGLFTDKECVAVMGYRVLYDFVHGKHVYVDDLVVTNRLRSKGIGAMLLAYAERRSRELECDGMRLCTGVENTSAISFYKRNGWLAGSVAFKKTT
jgi:ribosomal protein S18 acetylase RimI-like enzyme